MEVAKRFRVTFVMLAAVATMLGSALPAFAANERGCGIGDNVGKFSSEAAKSGNGRQNGEFASRAAQTAEPNFGQEISGPTGATICARGR